MSDQKYNSWANYETWLAKLWIDNEQGWRESILERAATVDAYTLGESIRKELEKNAPVVTGLYADMLLSAIRAVNWYALGAAYVGEAADNAKYA